MTLNEDLELQIRAHIASKTNETATREDFYLEVLMNEVERLRSIVLHLRNENIKLRQSYG